MIMHRYEILLLAVPEVTQDETKSVENEITRLVRSAKGTILSFERWGKYKLAYPVRKNDYGVFFLTRFEVPTGTAVMDDIKSLFTIKLNNVVMRNMFSRLDLRQSLEYQRPKSLEETPTSRDVSTFLKENKMEGLLSSVDSMKKAEKKEPKEAPKSEPEVSSNNEKSEQK